MMDKLQSKYLEFKNINKEIVDWLEDIAEENNCRIEKKEWKSKYNSYVIYDYEPFCSDGFEINLLLSSYDASYLNFIKYLYNEKISTIEYLNNCIKIPAIKNYIWPLTRKNPSGFRRDFLILASYQLPRLRY